MLPYDVTYAYCKDSLRRTDHKKNVDPIQYQILSYSFTSALRVDFVAPGGGQNARNKTPVTIPMPHGTMAPVQESATFPPV